MIVDCAHYRDGVRQHEGPLPLEEAAARCGEGGFVWLGMFEPPAEELAKVQAAFGLHELAIEDAQSFHLRPKAEHYESGIYFVILRTARYLDDTEEVEFGEISVFLGPNFVITVRQGAASDLHGGRLRLERHPELLATGSGSVLWAVVDCVIDGYAPVVEGLERDIEEVEATVFSGAPAPIERIYLLRREVTDFYRAVHPLLAPFDLLLRRGGYADLIKGELLPYFRDIQDHLRLVNEEVAAQRDLLTTVLEANLALISVEQTRISLTQTDAMRQLTVIATVFLPLSFVLGFFGQNFTWLVTNIKSFAAFAGLGLGGLVLPCVALGIWLRRGSHQR
ncbi:MAG: magnesium and cobalt transport protein CorA [Mycobacteriales bacterium]